MQYRINDVANDFLLFIKQLSKYYITYLYLCILLSTQRLGLSASIVAYTLILWQYNTPIRSLLGPVNTIHAVALLRQKRPGKARGVKFGDSK